MMYRKRVQRTESAQFAKYFDDEYFIKKQRQWPVNKENQTELC